MLRFILIPAGKHTGKESGSKYMCRSDRKINLILYKKTFYAVPGDIFRFLNRELRVREWTNLYIISHHTYGV